MAALHTVDFEGRYDGLSLRQAMPRVVQEIVDAYDPIEIILFGSMALGEEGPDSDIDLLVVFEQVAMSDRRALMRRVRGAIRTFAPVDIVIADVAEIAVDRDAVGSAVFWPLREGRSVYRRLVTSAG